MSGRGTAKTIVASFLVGMFSIGAAWAGASLAPAPDAAEARGKPTTSTTAPSTTTTTSTTTTLPAPPIPPLGQGSVLAGASKVSIEPSPTGDEVWERDRAKCTPSQAYFEDLPNTADDHLAVGGSPWPENPNCLYMGGFSIGPVNPITAWDQEYGLWVRTAVIDDGTDPLILTVIDGEGWFWDYDKKCDDCGSKQIAERMASDLSTTERPVDPKSFVIAATHSHASPDFIGGWGFVPDWYMKQVTEAIEQSIREAWAAREQSVLEMGEENARPFNGERRGTYRSAEEQQVTWLRALTAGTNSPETIFTIGAFAAHPTTKSTNGGTAHADWVATFEQRVEERFGGIGLHFMTGLGNMLTRGGTDMGRNLANVLPEKGDGIRLDNTDLRVTQTTWAQPATNVPLTLLGRPGFFDRQFTETPAAVRPDKHDGTEEDPETSPCVSASPVSVEVPATAARIGELFALTAGPGELFANLTNTLKEKSGALVTMPLAQANDALGYLPQSFEMNPVGQQGPGFVLGGVGVINYEDAYSIDRCFGDMTLETTIDLLGTI